MKLQEIFENAIEPMQLTSRTQGGEHPKAVRKAGKKLLKKYQRKGELPMFLKKQAESVEI